MIRKLGIGSMEARLMRRRTLVLVLVTAFGLSSFPVYAAEKQGNGVSPTYDEAYYATLDYYGNLEEGSVVKSYTLNGATSLTDYGTYSAVNNLTDGTKPKTADGKTTFTFGKNNVPSHFYFEGKTTAPFENLPWTISMSYTLNGVPTKAEDLAGKSGEVEITINTVPNKNASAYAQNNYTLEAMTVFNQDDILSLEAEGAQVQLIGNLRVVLFLCLPGEEHHFVIRVGSDDFTFDGVTFMLAPATLSQLDQIADLSDKKDKLEKNYDKLDDSLDTLLDSMGNMSGSLNASAKGLDELNEARGTISAGKGDVYNSADQALGDMDTLNKSLDKIPDHLDTASQAVDDFTSSLNDVAATSKKVRSEMSDLKTRMDAVHDDLDEIKDLTGTSNSGDSDTLKERMIRLGDDSDTLASSLKTVRSSLSDLDLQIGGTGITVNGQTLDELNESLDKAKSMDTAYRAANGGNELNYQQFLIAASILSGDASDADEAAAKLQQVSDTTNAIEQIMASNNCTFAEAEDAYFSAVKAKVGDTEAAKLRQEYDSAVATQPVLQSVYTAVVGSQSGTMDEADFFTAMIMVQAIQKDSSKASEILANESTYAKQGQDLSKLYQLSKSKMTDGLLSNMSNLCSDLGYDSGVSKDLSKLSGLTGDTMGDLEDLIDEGETLTDLTDTLLGEVQDLNDLVNRYAPELKSSLSDTKDVVSNMSTTLSDTHGFLSTFESLMKRAGSQLDTGTKDTLTGLAASLREAAKSLSKTRDVKTAKNNISDIIKDVWDDYTGDVNNLLNMDSTAKAVSLTSTQNASPTSIQVLIRSQEIKKSDTEESKSSETKKSSGTFWGRVSQMFKDFWNTITGIFH